MGNGNGTMMGYGTRIVTGGVAAPNPNKLGTGGRLPGPNGPLGSGLGGGPMEGAVLGTLLIPLPKQDLHLVLVETLVRAELQLGGTVLEVDVTDGVTHVAAPVACFRPLERSPSGLGEAGLGAEYHALGGAQDAGLVGWYHLTTPLAGLFCWGKSKDDKSVSINQPRYSIRSQRLLRWWLVVEPARVTTWSLSAFRRTSAPSSSMVFDAEAEARLLAASSSRSTLS
uniref:Uncharacterized protein n=1 Tax=Anopheles farauti TaxID=69004 RepID=A0A182QPV6_9DIPT